MVKKKAFFKVVSQIVLYPEMIKYRALLPVNNGSYNSRAQVHPAQSPDILIR